MNVKLKAVAAGIVLALGTNVASAATAYQGTGANAPAEIWFELYDAANSKSYTLDTGIKLMDMVANPGQFNNQSFNLGTAGLPSGTTGVWGVFGVQEDSYASLIAAGGDPQSPLNASGQLVTVKGAAPNSTTFSDPLGPRSSMVGHIQFVNEKDPVSSINWPANRFETFLPADGGYFTNMGPRLTDTVGFDTVDSTSTTTLPFYFLTQYEDQDFNLIPVLGHNGAKLGDWQFNGTTLKFVTGGGSEVPVPAAVWLFASALTGLVTIGRRKSV